MALRLKKPPENSSMGNGRPIPCTAEALAASASTTPTDMSAHHDFVYRIRYAIRLTERTARLYRRVQKAGLFLSIVGGSATLTLLSEAIPAWLGLFGAALMTMAGAALVAVRPADQAAQNEADMRRYRALAVKAHQLDDAALSAALEEAHLSDCQEIEPLRDVAYNDVVREYGREDAAVPLSRWQHLLAALA
jgi:hypothetical protein